MVAAAGATGVSAPGYGPGPAPAAAGVSQNKLAAAALRDRLRKAKPSPAAPPTAAAEGTPAAAAADAGRGAAVVAAGTESSDGDASAPAALSPQPPCDGGLGAVPGGEPNCASDDIGFKVAESGEADAPGATGAGGVDAGAGTTDGNGRPAKRAKRNVDPGSGATAGGARPAPEEADLGGGNEGDEAEMEEGGQGEGLEEGDYDEEEELIPETLSAVLESGNDVEVAFLGTGSAEPSKYRGASAIHIRYFDDSKPFLNTVPMTHSLTFVAMTHSLSSVHLIAQQRPCHTTASGFIRLPLQVAHHSPLNSRLGP